MRVALVVVALGAAALGGLAVLWAVPSGESGTAAPMAAPVALEEPREARSARPAPVAAKAQPAEPACEPGTVLSMRTATTAYAAHARAALTAFAEPGGEAVSRFDPVNVNGVRTVLGVLAARVDGACAPTWYRVQLPIRPNGSTGWVRAQDVDVAEVRTRIVVDLDRRTVTLFRGGKRIVETVAAIGKQGTPTPTGSYYVNQRLLAADPGGVFGPGGIGISAFSPTLQDWVQGGPIAIHGTNQPHLLGQAVSYGCVRVHNAELERMMELAVEGTPVVIRG